MRENKFRGYDKENECWKHGNLIRSEGVLKEFEAIIIPVVENGMFTQETDLSFENWHKVIPETIGQYTEHDDKNGVKIYEGDIVEWYLNVDYEVSHLKGVVTWDDKHLKYYVREKLNNQMFKWARWNDKDYIVKVIGNIHENPELLEVEDEN